MLPEQWERRWKDYYQSLGVDPAAADTEILEAFRYKAQILHPDRLAMSSARVRQRAERDFKEVNEAYEVLRDPIRRRVYHAVWARRQQAPLGAARRQEEGDAPSPGPPCETRVRPDEPPPGHQQADGRPRPILDPPYLLLDGLSSNEKRQATFVVDNLGGPWSELCFRKSRAPWLTMVRRRPLDASRPLPLRVDIEVDASHMPADATLVGAVEVWLDDRVARLPINAHTAASKGRERTHGYSRPAPASTATRGPLSNDVGTGANVGEASQAAGLFNTGFWTALLLVAWAITALAFLVQTLFPSPHTSKLGETLLEWLATASFIGLGIWTYMASRRP
ncbi:MAG: J domain-containing protein [Bacteroidetes bacterium]|nr:J domain-containing protein [Bacteroidota bacterium]